MKTANAPLETMEAPVLKKVNGENEQAYLNMTFDTTKKYVFQLCVENPEPEFPIINMRTKRPEPHKKFKPFQNLVFTSQIVWNGERTNIRYYDGCTSVFTSEQPKEKETIDQLIKQTKPRNFLEGKLTIDGYERQLLLYMNLCSWNTESPFRTSTANQIFVSMNGEKIATVEAKKLDRIEEAMALAKSASFIKMKIHCSYLGIAMTDYDSGNELTEKELRTKYRTRASQIPDDFIKSYGNSNLELKYYIDQALVKGTINNKVNHNKAAWASSGTVICDISGLKTNDAIAQALFEFSKTEAGEDFAIQIKALND